ncbi:hypothetical protein BDD12DRAFT_174397 [Trichophaea hybrida]|nr:hypothetical protein BDD12DRAFT_174397 [Trichophaea hybrida]
MIKLIANPQVYINPLSLPTRPPNTYLPIQPLQQHLIPDPTPHATMSEVIMIVVQPQNPAITGTPSLPPSTSANTRRAAEITFKVTKDIPFVKISSAFHKRNNLEYGAVCFVIPDGEGGTKVEDDMIIEDVRLLDRKGREWADCG